MNLDIGAVTVQRVSCGAATSTAFLIIDKVLGREVLGINLVITTLIFSEACLIPIVVRKRGISLAKVAIGNVGIDALLLGVRY
jgi:hypothetical protein